MRQFLLGVLATVAVPSAAGAVIGPPISFSSGNSIYLVNPDGTGLSTVYQGARGTAVQSVDLKPGGGEVAFVENHVLKVLTYGETGRPTSAPRTISLPCAVALEVDHNPTDGSLAVKDGCAPNHIWRVNSTGAHLMITQPSTIGDIRWSSDGSHLYYEFADGIRAFYPATGATQTVYPDHTIWNPTLTGDRLILASTNNNYFIHDFATGIDAPGCTQGQMIHDGNDDAQMVFRIPAHNGFYVAVESTSCAGGPRLITGHAGAYAGIDWAAP